LERAHAEFFGQGTGLAVRGFSLFGVLGLTLRSASVTCPDRA